MLKRLRAGFGKYHQQLIVPGNQGIFVSGDRYNYLDRGERFPDVGREVSGREKCYSKPRVRRHLRQRLFEDLSEPEQAVDGDVFCLC